ncbi:MAG: AI-2E family transporter [Chloroflexaceae bacterium]|nr:AI-2E family transporter [Chloroflexaceae bacterium]
MAVEPKLLRFSTPAKVITVAIVVGLTILTLQHATPVLAPFIAAIITAYLFNPVVGWLQRRTNLGRGFWISVLYVIAFGLLYALFTWGWPRLANQYRELVAALPGLITDLTRFFEQQGSINLGGGLVFDLRQLEEQIVGIADEIVRTLSSNAPRLVFSALETVVFLLVYLIVTFYLLLQSGDLKLWTYNLIPAPYREEIAALGRQIDRVLGAFIRGQLVLIVIMAVLLYIPLAILGVPYAPLIAIASGVLETIPILGPWTAGAIAVTVALFQPEVPFGLSNGMLAVLLGIIYFTLRQIEDNFIIPNVMGPLVHLHPALVIFVVLVGGAVAGPFGLFIAIPVAAVGRIVLNYLYRKLTDQPEPPAPPPAAAAEAGHKKASVVPPTLPPEQV